MVNQMMMMRCATNFSFPTSDVVNLSSTTSGAGGAGGAGAYTSNRERLDSGTSGSSESSRGSGKPPRRRSHRPRGCRGGSNRRRNGEKKSNPDCKSPVKVNNENRPKQPDSKSSVQSKRGPSIQKYSSGLPMQEFTILSRQGGTNNKMNGGMNVGWNKGISSSLSVSTAPTSDYTTEYSSSLGSYDLPSFGRSAPIELPPEIQLSFSDSSMDFSQDGRMHSNHMQPPPSRYPSFMGDTDGQILPPLPSQSFQNPPITSGPNPYALKLVAHENTHNSDYKYNQPTRSNQRTHHDMTGMDVMGGYSTPMKPYATPSYHHTFQTASYATTSTSTTNSNDHNCGTSSNNSSNNNNRCTTTMPPPLSRSNCYPYNQFIAPFQQNKNHVDQPNQNQNHNINNNASTENDYRSERLQIQRQTVEGGSLFVTSPRSFLMGKRTNVPSNSPSFFVTSTSSSSGLLRE